MTDNIRNEFDQLSGQDNFITREQMMKYMEENGVENGNEKVRNFFETLDTNKDGRVSFEEFSLGYVTAKHQNLIDFLPKLTSSLVAVKKAEKSLTVDNNKQVSVSLQICDEECPKIEDMPYRMCVNLGFDGSNSNQESFKEVGIIGGHKVGFFFKTGEDQQEVTTQIEEQMKDLLEMLKEFGPEAAEHIDQLQVVSEHKGTQSFVGIDLQNSMFAMIAQSFLESITEMMKSSKAQLNVNLGTTLDLCDIQNLKSQHAYDAKMLFQINSNMQSGLDLAVDQLQKNTELVKEKDSTLFGALLASSISKLNLTINFDAERRKKHLQSMFNEEENYGQKIIDDTKKMLEEHELKDQLSTFTQVQEIYNILKEHKVKQWGIFVSMKEALLTVDLHGDLYEFIDAIELFE